MGKGDKKRAQRMIDQQGAQSQNYLSGTQNQIGNMNWNTGNAMWGNEGMLQPGAVDRGAFTGPYQPGGASQRTNPNGGGDASTGGQTFTREQVKSQLMPYLQSLGGASSETLERAMPEIQRMFPGARFDTSSGPKDEIVVPGVGIIDLIANAETGGTKSWTFQNNGPGGGGGGGGMGGAAGQAFDEHGNIMRRYEKFADTGGYSEQDKANIRQRAVAPIRSMYERGTQELDRQKALQGGYSPGHATALTRMNRNMGQGMSDATGNAEANISQMVHAGKLAGMGGMASQYGNTPGLANMFGNQQLQSQQNMLGAAGTQVQLGNSMMQNQMKQGEMRGIPWGSIMKGIGTGAMVAAGSSRKIKHGIKEISSKDVVNKLKKLKLYEWKYRGEDTKHVGPIAEEFKDIMGVGDGKSIH